MLQERRLVPNSEHCQEPEMKSFPNKLATYIISQFYKKFHITFLLLFFFLQGFEYVTAALVSLSSL